MNYLEPRKRYERNGDMSPDENGDIIVSIYEPEKLGGHSGAVASVQFCTVGSGGGRSPNVRKALVALAAAIEKDNVTRPTPENPCGGVEVMAGGTKPTWEETRQKLRDAGGDAWDKIADPTAYIREMRGGEEK